MPSGTSPDARDTLRSAKVALSWVQASGETSIPSTDSAASALSSVQVRSTSRTAAPRRSSHRRAAGVRGHVPVPDLAEPLVPGLLRDRRELPAVRLALPRSLQVQRIHPPCVTGAESRIPTRPPRSGAPRGTSADAPSGDCSTPRTPTTPGHARTTPRGPPTTAAARVGAAQLSRAGSSGQGCHGGIPGSRRPPPQQPRPPPRQSPLRPQ